jgi:signal transduction histidine kinase
MHSRFIVWRALNDVFSGSLGILCFHLDMTAWIKRLECWSKPSLMVTSLGLVAAVGTVDYFTGFIIFFSAFYLIPVTLAAWFVGRAWGNFISSLSVTVWLAGDYAAGAKYSSLLVPVWNGVIALTVYFVVVKTLVSLRKLRNELEERVRQRTTALTNEMLERTRLEKELLEIGERGQRQIGHDLHDGLGQHLTATAFASQVLAGQLESKSLPEAADAKHLVKMVEEAISLTRTFARGLQPVEMEAEGLTDGFQELARNVSERFKVSCEFECRESVLLQDAARSTHLYRIAQEAITNAIKHGRAKFINVSLEKNRDAITLTITDDGSGLPENARHGEGMGLRIMAYRAGMIGATFNIERMPDSGTRVTCKLPLLNSAVPEIHGAKN